MSEKKPFCPNVECESAHIVPVKRELGGTEWMCKQCKEYFDGPEYREVKPEPGTYPRQGLSRKLVEMEPDDL